MASAGKSAGRVSVRVVPDTTQFREKLRGELATIERHLEVTIRAVFDDGHVKAEMDKLQRSLNSKKVELQAVLDRSGVDRQLRDIQRNGNGSKIQLQASVNSKLARAEVARVARNRFIDLSIRVNKASLAKAGTALAALSGGRAVGDSLKNLGTYLSNLDRNIPKLAGVALAVANIGAAGLASVGGLLTLGAGLAQLGGLAVVLPGLLGGAAVGAVTLGLALKDAGKALGGLKPQFQAFQKAISGRFWEQAAGPIRQMVKTLLPQFQTGMSKVSTSLGLFAALLSKTLTSNLSGNILAEMMDNLAFAIGIARGAIEPLVEAFTTLGSTGSRYLPALSRYLVEISEQFNQFVQGADSDGFLTQWVDNGIAALKLLGSAITSVGSILAGLFAAAKNARSGGLEAFTANLKAIATVVNGPAFQGALTTFFSGAAAGLKGLGSAIGPIGRLFESLAPTIAGVFTTAGTAVGSFLGKIASALSQPAFATGLSAFFDGIATGLKAIAPALPAVATALGALGSVAGALAGTIGSVLGAALAALAPVVKVLARALTPLIPVLGSALVGAIKAVAPALLKLVSAFASGLGPIITGLVPIIAMIATAFSTLLTQIAPLIPVIGAGLVTVLEILVPALLQVVAAVGGQLGPIITALVPAVTAFATSLALIIPIITPLIVQILQMIPALLQMLTAFQNAGNQIGLLGAVLTSVGASIQSVVAVISGALQVMTAIITGNFAAIPGIVAASMSAFLGYVNAAFGGAGTKIASFASAAVARMYAFASGVVSAVSSAMSRFTSSIASGVSSAGSRIASFVSSAVAKIRSFGSTVISTVTSAMSRFVSAIQSGISRAVSLIASLPGRARSALGNVGGALVGAGASLVEGFINGMRSAIGRVAAQAAALARAAVNAAKGALDINSPSKVFRDEVGKSIPEGMIAGIRSGQRAVNETVADLTKVPALSKITVARTSDIDVSEMGRGSAGGVTINGNQYGHTAKDVAAELFSLMQLKEALEPSWT